MKILVGTANPAKLRAVEVVTRLYFGPGAAVLGVNAPSGVRDTPQSDDESIQGARHRAQYCLELDPTADLGIGIEAGLSERDGHLFAIGWCIIRSRAGDEVMGSGQNVPLPKVFYEALRQGEDLREIAKQMGFGYDHHQGLIGALAEGNYTREQALIDSLKLTLQAFTHPSLYHLKQKVTA